MDRNLKKELNRQKILTATLKLYLKQGIKATSVRDISRESQISYVTMYKYFDNKNVLTQSALACLIDQAFAEAQKTILNRKLTFMERMHAFPNHKHLFTTSTSEVITELNNYIQADEILTTKITEHLNELFKLILQEGRKAGFVQTTASDQAIIMLLSALNSFRTNVSNEKFHQLIPDIIQILLYGLAHPGQKLPH